MKSVNTWRSARARRRPLEPVQTHRQIVLNEWRQLALVVDRLLFCVYICISILVAVVMLHWSQWCICTVGFQFYGQIVICILVAIITSSVHLSVSYNCTVWFQFHGQTCLCSRISPRQSLSFHFDRHIYITLIVTVLGYFIHSSSHICYSDYCIVLL